MGDGMTWNDIKALEALFTPAGSSKEDRSLCQKKKAITTPAAIANDTSKHRERETSERNVEKLDPDLEFGDRYGRIEPEYEILYKQDVSASDVYLQMSEQNPSSLSCNVMVLRVKLPQTESASDIRLDLRSKYIKLSTNLYFLALYLPYPTKQEESNAKWEVDTERLIITMPIIREFVA